MAAQEPMADYLQDRAGEPVYRAAADRACRPGRGQLSGWWLDPDRKELFINVSRAAVPAPNRSYETDKQ